MAQPIQTTSSPAIDPTSPFPQYAKGHLYKIKNKQDETIGYLCSTIHFVPQLNNLTLHPKIFSVCPKVPLLPSKLTEQRRLFLKHGERNIFLQS